MFERQTEIALANLERIAPVLGDRVEAVFVCGTDFGTQTGTFCSVGDLPRALPALLQAGQRLDPPPHRLEDIQALLRRGGKLHGAFIEAGFDIINPVQCSATGMEPEKLKERYGDRLAFWGGGVDTQRTLPFGTPARCASRCCGVARCSPRGGGFVFNAIHNVQAVTPVENMVAMLEAVRSFSGAAR